MFNLFVLHDDSTLMKDTSRSSMSHFTFVSNALAYKITFSDTQCKHVSQGYVVLFNQYFFHV